MTRAARPADLSLLRAIAEACDLQLSATQWEQFAQYGTLLLSWRQRVNLTGITDWEGLQRTLFGDALALVPLVLHYCQVQRSEECTLRHDAASAARIPSPESIRGCRLLDVGTGAGIPGIPLKLALPHLDLTLLEATGKKVAFLRHVLQTIGLPDVVIAHGRAEEFAHDPGYRGHFDLVTARGLAPLPTLLELCLPFLHVGGYGIFPKGPHVNDEIHAAHHALQILGGTIVDVRTPPHPALATTRIVVVQLERPVPLHYPRRAGIPQKRPILSRGTSAREEEKEGQS
jgi:16S rRNA (guanine527-N7)-methyltransferase